MLDPHLVFAGRHPRAPLPFNFRNSDASQRPLECPRFHQIRCSDRAVKCRGAAVKIERREARPRIRFLVSVFVNSDDTGEGFDGRMHISPYRLIYSGVLNVAVKFPLVLLTVPSQSTKWAIGLVPATPVSL